MKTYNHGVVRKPYCKYCGSDHLVSRDGYIMGCEDCGMDWNEDE